MKIILSLFLILSYTFAKKDFYYSYIDSSGNQISENLKQTISDTRDKILQVKKYISEGRTDEAYDLANEMIKTNKVEILQSDVILSFAEASLALNRKRYAKEAADILEAAINSSVIHEKNLPQAYMHLVDLKLSINRTKDATYYADVLLTAFDDPKTKAYGKIYKAKVLAHVKDYRQAEVLLYEILTKTTDLDVATIVADYLYDIYIADRKRDKAYELISKVLEKNIDFYANNSYKAMEKIKKLLQADMPEFAQKILLELIERTDNPDSIEDFKYMLANIYMDMYDRTDTYLNKALSLYEELLRDFPRGLYIDKVKMYIDEIYMRLGRIKPVDLEEKYRLVASMQQKLLLQELFNYLDDKNFDAILRAKRVYEKIADSIAKRFGYKNMDMILDKVTEDMIKNFIDNNKCAEVKESLLKAKEETLSFLIGNDDYKFKFFDCLIEVPYDKAYKLTKKAFRSSRDADIYHYLEKMALSLNYVDEALTHSQMVDMIGDEKVLSDEFLTRFELYTRINDDKSMDKFFTYAKEHQDYIDANVNKPVIIDFYYAYYLYLLKQNNILEAQDILVKLNEKQDEFGVRIYSPFVEMELAKNAKSIGNEQEALDYLKKVFTYDRVKLTDNDKARLYYEMVKLYESLDKKREYVVTLNKCKELDGLDDNLYKQMCDKLE